MSIALLHNPAEEETSAHVELTDAEIIKLAQDLEQEEEDTVEEEVVAHSLTEKLAALSLSIYLLEVFRVEDRAAHRALRRIQSELRSVNTTQTTLDAWLK